MYAAKELLAHFPLSKVLIFEKSRYPYGILRSGVAPDNLPIKAIARQFDELLKDKRVKLCLNK